MNEKKLVLLEIDHQMFRSPNGKTLTKMYRSELIRGKSFCLSGNAYCLCHYSQWVDPNVMLSTMFMVICTMPKRTFS